MRITQLRETSRNLLRKPCPECGSENVKEDNGTVVAKVVCENCGYRDSKWRMHLGWGKTDNTDLTNSNNSETNESKKDDSEDNSVRDESIAEKVKRINEHQNGILIGGIAGGGILILFGLLLSITVIGSVIGIPLIILGIITILSGVGAKGIQTAKNAPKESIWLGTELEEPGNMGTSEVQAHRKVNKEFGGKCPVCGKFASLRNESTGFGKNSVPDEVRCSECEAKFEREQAAGWRLIEGDDDRLGERHTLDEWQDQLRENELKQSEEED